MFNVIQILVPTSMLAAGIVLGVAALIMGRPTLDDDGQETYRTNSQRLCGPGPSEDRT